MRIEVPDLHERSTADIERREKAVPFFEFYYVRARQWQSSLCRGIHELCDMAVLKELKNSSNVTIHVSATAEVMPDIGRSKFGLFGSANKPVSRWLGVFPWRMSPARPHEHPCVEITHTPGPGSPVVRPCILATRHRIFQPNLT